MKTTKSRTVRLFRCSNVVRAAGSKILAAFLFFSAGLVLLDGKNILILFFAVIIQISIEKRISICYNVTERTEMVIFQGGSILAFTEYETEQLRKALMKETRRCAVTLGMKKTSVDQLTKAVGIAKGSFYKFYESKEMLFFAVLEGIHSELYGVADRALSENAGLPAAERAAKAVLAVCRRLSATLSPFEADELCASEKPRTLPPSSSIAASKLRRVLVDGSKNRVASFLPLHFSLYFSGFAIISLATPISSSISPVVSSEISIRLLI